MTTRCALHPDVETALRCSRCGQLICPKCLVQTPVGARCPQCAQLRRIPTFEVSFRHYLIAAAVGLGLGVAGGLVWGFLPFRGLFSFFIALGLGYGVGEIISLSVNRKRGVGLQVIAGLSVLISYVLQLYLVGGLFFAGLAFFRDFYGLMA
ncbi:MAG: hypothetical protein Q8O76_08680, partial [Chloroflexota bacterium]|nr:hypothetical protein [Chloroflexota bacterium]